MGENDDLKAQFEAIENEEPSLHKLDKKMTIILFHQLENNQEINCVKIDLKTARETEIPAVSERVKKVETKLGGYALAGSIIIAILGVVGLFGWLLHK
jgi:hypothetical protein